VIDFWVRRATSEEELWVLLRGTEQAADTASDEVVGPAFRQWSQKQGLVLRLLLPDQPALTDEQFRNWGTVLRYLAANRKLLKDDLIDGVRESCCDGVQLRTLVPPRICAAMDWDSKLHAVYPVYQALRRHIWRRVLSAHKTCARSAAARMWWDVEGDVIARFSPVAEAFLRWRMFWEGFGVPADLFRTPRHPAFGVLAWLCDGAPGVTVEPSLSCCVAHDFDISGVPPSASATCGIRVRRRGRDCTRSASSLSRPIAARAWMA
jgi:hypothetical protein